MQPKPHMLSAVAAYEEGKITKSEFVTLACQLAAPEEIEAFVAGCPPDLLASLRETLVSYSDDEASWPRTYRMGTYAPWVTPEEVEESQRREQHEIRRGVRLVKEYFARR